MFDVLSVQDKKEQERLAALCGAQYLPDALAYSLTVEEKFAGICQFYIRSGYGEIASLDKTPDFDGTAEGSAEQYLAALCRTSLSFLELIGIPTAIYGGKEKTKSQMIMCGFHEADDGKWSTDLKELFSHCASESTH